MIIGFVIVITIGAIIGIFAINVLSIILDIGCWIAGIIGVAICLIEILFLFKVGWLSIGFIIRDKI